MSELLIEFLCEEIPSRMQLKAAEDLRQMLTAQLTARGLTFDAIKSYVTPRRLTVVATKVPAMQEAVTTERRGPRVDAPAAALEGFVTSTGLPLDKCEQRETPKGTFYFASLTQPAQETLSILPALVSHLLEQFPWPKSMTWSLGPTQRWVRPLHGILCIFEGKPVQLGLAIPSPTQTAGHRFLASQPVTVQDAASYVENLRQAHVLACPLERRATIAQLVQAAAAEKGLKVRADDGLLDEVTGLVEWPYVLLGKIDHSFMDLPEEALITVMRHHQRYFALETAAGILAPFFITVANSLFADGGATATRGNEHVLRARLSDAMFFWQEDCKKPLETHAQNLSRLIFHAKLGTVAEKCTRIGLLAEKLNQLLELKLETSQVALTARLLKADLTTQTVIELPELQGAIGYHLSHHEKLPEAIALAIRDHYAPQGPSASVAKDPLSLLMSLSDKLDTLAGFFLIDEKPTGSKDPYALRRAALGIIRTVLENKLASFILAPCLAAALGGYPAHQAQAQQADVDLKSFFADRLKVFLRDAGLRHDVAAAAMGTGSDGFVVIWDKAQALGQFLTSDPVTSTKLTQSFKRASNILAAAKNHTQAAPNPSLFKQKEETDLFEALTHCRGQIQTCLAPLTQANIAQALTALSSLGPVLDAFFVEVTVNTEDLQLQANRLNLLAQAHHLFISVIDFSALEG
jgi:glycyl-tRNA synthetase beta chain